MDIPETRYAKTIDGVHIAYQVVGDGPVDLVFVPPWVSDVEIQWEEPYRLADEFVVTETAMIVRLEELRWAHRDEGGAPASGPKVGAGAASVLVRVHLTCDGMAPPDPLHLSDHSTISSPVRRASS